MKRSSIIKNLPEFTNYNQIDSPIGMLILVTSDQGLHAVLWDHDLTGVSENIKKSKKDDVMIETQKQLYEYFEGRRKQFNLPLVIHGTDFQRSVWEQLTKIPYSKTISYGEQALRIGDKKKARAVGMANGSNPISIIIPCHRVIGSNGQLTGFGGGLDKKAYLLELEQIYV